MINRIFRGRRRRIQTMATHLESERRLLQRAVQQGRVELQQKLHGGWSLTGCFAGGLLVGRYGARLFRPLGRTAWLTLARWIKFT